MGIGAGAAGLDGGVPVAGGDWRRDAWAALTSPLR